MKYDLIEQTAKRTGLPPKILFTFAYMYCECPRTRATCNAQYVEWTKSGKYSRAVEDMCLDILSSRVEILKGMPAVEAYQKALAMMQKPIELRKAE